jgi:hypothetical protein
LVDINEEQEDSVNNMENKDDGMEFNNDSIKNQNLNLNENINKISDYKTGINDSYQDQDI